MASKPQFDERSCLKPGEFEQVVGKRAMGRPCEFDDIIADEVCVRLAEGESLIKICRDAHMPQTTTIYDWRRKFPHFALQYARAREDQGDTYADQINDVRQQVASGELDAQAARVIIDALKWEAGKRKAKIYGDSTMLKHADANGEQIKQTIDVTKLDPEERDTLRALLTAAKQRALPAPEDADYEEVEGDEEA